MTYIEPDLHQKYSACLPNVIFLNFYQSIFRQRVYFFRENHRQKSRRKAATTVFCHYHVEFHPTRKLYDCMKL